MFRPFTQPMFSLTRASLPIAHLYVYPINVAMPDGADDTALTTQSLLIHGRSHAYHQTSPRGLDYYIARLSREDVPMVHKLQKEVRRELVRAGQANFTIGKTERDYISRLESGAIMLGMFNAETDELMGQSMISPHSGPVPGIPRFASPSGRTFLREGTMVKRAYRGHSLNKSMLKVQREIVGAEGTIVVEIDVSNIFNLMGLMASGFIVYDAYVDPKNGGQALALTTLPPSGTPKFTPPIHYANSYDGIRPRLEQGYLGTHLRNNEIGFARLATETS